MTTPTDNQISSIHWLLHKHELKIDQSRKPFLLSGDGSDRRFYRFFLLGGSSIVAVIPATAGKRDLAEAESYYEIGMHLLKKDIPVPQFFGFDPTTGINITEDLGEVLLYDNIKNDTITETDRIAYYQDALNILVSLQLEGVQGFEPKFCFDTENYDRKLMLEREAGYFQKAFCEDFAGIEVDNQRMGKEFIHLADKATKQPSSYLLHRDFQSRNIMIHKDSLKIIDFQGARYGPLQYDIASLLIDPYVRLSDFQQQTLLDYYMSLLEKHLSLDQDFFLEGYYYIALLRNLQIVGAFAFLFQVKGKFFFRSFLVPAVRTLCAHLEKPEGNSFTYLKLIADKGLDWIGKNSNQA